MTPAAVDPRLSEILSEADGGKRLQPIAELLAGIAAAPPRPDGYPGIGLVTGVDPAVARKLESWATERARRYASDVERPEAGAERLAALRAELRRRGLSGFIVPLNDEHHGEYIPRRAQRLAWLTGFTGSAGLAIVLPGKAAVFSDGRYTLQLRTQIDLSLFEPHHVTESPPLEWLARNLGAGERVGYDPWLHTIDGAARLQRACERAGAELVAVENNPIDAVWADQPPPPLAPVLPLPLDYAGEASADKRGRLAANLVTGGIRAAVLTLPDSIAWLLNIRGGDVAHTPVPLSFAILYDDARVELFMDARKAGPGLEAHLGNGVSLHPPKDFGPALDALGRARSRVMADPMTAAAWVFDRLRGAGASIHQDDDPCLLPKACKNPVELAGARNAHRRDGAALTRFLAWVTTAAVDGDIDELAAADRLQAFRREAALFQDLSFTTISGAGPNGAVVHYRVTPQTNRLLEAGSLYLVDSGAQYLDGTTDITRTVAIGSPSAEMRDRFTRVLKGHIALATCRFPAGTTGSQLDILARQPLWNAGLDYDHGTGHGVGSFLAVHEGPQRISKAGNTVALRPGMILSNEPGYYKTGAYGIRIENLVVVTPMPAPPGAERPLLGFETLTRAPIDRALIDVALLSEAERQWVDDYHAAVLESLSPLLDPPTRAWLEMATAPLDD